jgi:hypothetical protein
MFRKLIIRSGQSLPRVRWNKVLTFPFLTFLLQSNGRYGGMTHKQIVDCRSATVTIVMVIGIDDQLMRLGVLRTESCQHNDAPTVR